MKHHFLVSIIVLATIGCTKSDDNHLEYKSFQVESFAPGLYLDFKTPKTYLDIYDYDDTLSDMSQEIAFLINKQNEMQDAYFFYDSITPSDYISVVSGERFILTEKPPSTTYFAQPSRRFYEFFPRADSARTILYEWRNKEYKDISYHKTQYKLNIDGQTYYQAIYFLMTLHQSAIVATVSKTDLNLDLYVLNMEVILED